MKEGQGLTWAQIRYWSMCGTLIVIGLCLAVLSHELPWPAAQAIVKEIGSGALIAGILASFVEPFFRNEFARDAFLAAFRYVLPKEFKDEVEKIIKFEFLADMQVWTVDVKKVDDDDQRVLVTTTVERTFKNKTKSKQQVSAKYEVEDFDFPNGPTSITECSIASIDEPDRVKVFRGVKNKTSQKEAESCSIDLEPGKSAKIWMKAVQYRNVNDAIYETFRIPITNPEIRLQIDESEFDHRYAFGTSGDVIKEKFKNHYKLSGVYFPGQFMLVRWWPKQKDQIARG